MKNHEPAPQPPNTPLAVLRSVESTPAGDLEWALHCTRQQAVIVRLLLPNGLPPISIETLSAAIEIPIWGEPGLPAVALPLYTEKHKAILVEASLDQAARLRAALQALKHLIDIPAREGLGENGFGIAEYAYLAQRFADMVLEEHGP